MTSSIDFSCLTVKIGNDLEEVGQGHRGHSLSITWAYGLYRDASSPPCPCVFVNLIAQPLLGRHLGEE